MDSTERAAHWNEVYASKPANRVSWFQAAAEPSMRMIRASGVAQDAGIIDIGGGASVLVDELLAARFTAVSVLDIAETALEKTITRLGAGAAKVQWIVADVLSWIPQRNYELWHDRAVFHFLTEEKDRAAYRAVLRKALKPDGTLIVAAFAADGPERCSGLPVQRGSAETLAAAFGNEFRLTETSREEHRTPWGAVQPFTWTRFEKV
jgi:hypothetical protein